MALRVALKRLLMPKGTGHSYQLLLWRESRQKQGLRVRDREGKETEVKTEWGIKGQCRLNNGRESPRPGRNPGRAEGHSAMQQGGCGCGVRQRPHQEQRMHAGLTSYLKS